MAEFVCPAGCDEGWICEQHPERGWPDSDPGCAGPGMPCMRTPCPFWPAGQQVVPMIDGSGRRLQITREPLVDREN
jgi:hypothetical protein